MADQRTRYKDKINTNINIRVYIEEDAYEGFKKLTQEYGISMGDYMRMRLYSSLSYGYISKYETEHTYMERKVNKLVICVPADVREQFQKLCGENGTTQSEVFRGWVYKCLDVQRLVPRDF